jgi:WD40 repeat protein
MRFLTIDTFSVNSNSTTSGVKITCYELITFDDKEFMFIGASNGRLYSFELSNKQLKNRAELLSHESYHSGPVTCLCYSKQQSIILSGSCDRSLKIWQPKEFHLIQTLYGHEGTISCICDGYDGSIISCSIDGCFKLWCPARNRQMMKYSFFECTFSIKSIPGADGWIQALAVKV